MEIKRTNTEKFITFYNPYRITYVMKRPGQRVTTFYASLDQMPAAVRNKYVMMQRCAGYSK